eukprot:gene705-754_t
MTTKGDNTSSYVTRIRGLKETPQDIALRALRAITKSNKSAIQLENVPSDFLFGENVDLQRWTIVLKDKDLKELSEQETSGKQFYLDGSATTLAGVFQSFSTPMTYPDGLLKLNLTAAKDITDYGIAMVARKSPHLQHLILTGCVQITDIGLREVAMNCPQLQTLNISSCPGIEGVGIAAIAECCLFLTKLNLSKNTIKNWSLQKIFRKCLKLEELNVSYMKDISDEEIRVVAEHCHDLLQLEAIDCVYLSDQSMLTLSQYCKDLDYLDLSRNEMAYRITDVTLMALGQRCHSLRTLKINHCEHITDVGLHWLSEGCKIIETLELYGCNKLTDAGMRILGKECHALTSIDISHAKSISDVGIANLAKGCKNLQKLRCHAAFLLSDPRFFADAIQNHIPKTTAKDERSEDDFDVLNMSTTLLTSKSTSALSEPSLLSNGDGSLGGASGGAGSAFLFEGSLPTLKTPISRGGKGIPKKLEIWEESIGIVALVQLCPLLSSLDLSGCFRLNRVLGKSISTLQYLKILNLKGCNQVTSPSLIALFSKLSLLQELNLSDCGKGVSNDVMHTIAQSCPKLKIFYVARCFEITGKGMKGIANMTLLEKLDLSGCKYLNDSRMVYIVSSDKLRHLQTLDISHIPKITDSFLAWISLKDHKLLYISMKGTDISQKALVSVKDRFPYCDLLMNDNYYGFWPKFRVGDRILINSYATMIRGIIILQSKARKLIATRYVSGILYERKLLAAHITIQKIVRKFIARCIFIRKKNTYLLNNTSAEKMTSLFRGIHARKRVQKIKKNRNLRYLHLQATIIQCFYRSYRSRLLLKQKQYQKYLRHQRRVQATIIIQSVIRMYLGKCYYYKKRELALKQIIFINSKASLIQRVFRGYIGRTKFETMKAIVIALQRKRVAKTRIIQRAYRSYRIRRNIYERVLKRRVRHYASIMIQALGRGFITRMHYSQILYEHETHVKLIAATKIQCIYRVYIAKKIFFAKIRLIHQQKKKFNDAASCIVRQARIKLARLALKRKRQAYIQRLKEQTQHTIHACIKIQSMMRRYLCQRQYYQRLHQVKNQWKELFDESKQKRFFYNKLTGEIRWKIPQDLLDLIPNAKCDNCNMVDAMIECKQCSELFCSSCFQTIHFNGRRKEHEFRSLYDYYGKRIDYGDGVYPCQWPTEIIQDQIQGWMLRVAPYRKPRKIYPATEQSQWEEYEFNENDYNTLHKSIQNIKTSEEQRRIQKLIIKSSPKIFYFNRKTFETTYDIPDEVKQLILLSRPNTTGGGGATTNGGNTRINTALSSSFLFTPPMTMESNKSDTSALDPNYSFYNQSMYQPYDNTMDPSQSYMYQTAGGTYRGMGSTNTSMPNSMPNTVPNTVPGTAQDPMMQTRGSSVMNSRGGTRHQHYYYPSYYYQQPGFNATAVTSAPSPALAAFSRDTQDSVTSGEFSAPTTSGIPAPMTGESSNDPNNSSFYYYYYYSPTTAGAGDTSNLMSPYQAPSTANSQYWYASPSPGTAADPNSSAYQQQGYYDEHGQWQWYDYSQYYYPQQQPYYEQQPLSSTQGNLSKATDGISPIKPKQGNEITGLDEEEEVSYSGSSDESEEDEEEEN